VVSEHSADSDYLQDRLPRFEQVLKDWRQIRSVQPALDRDLMLGADLFNEKLFFDCHEYLEGAWRRSEGEEKIMIQGLIQAAAAFHKLELGSLEGCAELLDKAIEKLAKTRDPRWNYLRVFAVDLENAKKEVWDGTLDSDRVPRLGTMSP
jgi:hypothetical protein